MTKAMAVVLDEKVDLTDAQKYALFQAVEYHYKRIGENYVGQEEQAIELEFATYGTEMALIRKGLVEKKSVKDHWGRMRDRPVLSRKAIEVGVAEFTRMRKQTPKDYAKALQDASKKRLEKRRAEVDKVANLFIGLTIQSRNGRKVSMERFIHDRLWEGSRPVKDGKVELSVKQLKTLGEQIQNLVP